MLLVHKLASFLAASLAVFSCGGATECHHLSSPIDVVVADLPARWSQFESRILCVSAQPLAPSWLVSENQMRGELGDERFHAVADLVELLVDGTRENQSPLRGADLRVPIVSGREQAPVGSWVLGFCRPAIPSDGSRALVRFYSALDYGGTYLLERCEHGGWAVRWAQYAAYPL